MDIRDLKKIGLTEGEMKVYQALLELGETTRTELAKKSGIIHFSAGDPNRLKDFLEKKEDEIKKEKELVATLLPTLLAKWQDTHEDVDIEVFYGWDGLKTA